MLDLPKGARMAPPAIVAFAEQRALVTDTDLTEAAACLWEAALEGLTVGTGVWDMARAEQERDGTSVFRMGIIGWAEDVHRAWEAAVRDGYDAPFDWDFVPAWLERKLASQYGVAVTGG